MGAAERVRNGLLSPTSSTIYIVIGQSNWQSNDEGTSSWFPIPNAFPQTFKVGRWASLWPAVHNNAVTPSANFSRNTFVATDMNFNGLRIGDTSLGATVYHGLVPMYLVEYQANIATNTRNLRINFAPPDLSQTWATAPTLFGDTSQEAEILMFYMSTATGMPAASTPRLNGLRSATSSAAGTSIVASTHNWASPGDGSVSTAIIDVGAPASTGLYPAFALLTNASDETGMLAMVPYARLTDTPGTQIYVAGRGNFGYAVSLSTAPGNGWTDSTNNTTDAGIDQFLAGVKTSTYDHLVWIDCIGAGDVVSGALPGDLDDTISAFHTRLRARGAAAGFSTTEVVHVAEAPSPAVVAQTARMNELNSIKRTLAGDNSELFVSLWDYFGGVELPAEWMEDDRHQTELGAVGVSQALWQLLTSVGGSRGAVSYARAYVSQRLAKERRGNSG